ncbi:MAG: hydroxymethylbilane synthase [Bacteroidetes bacterium]|jgi:hydroxymethylbilane synthase|nr:hydroxymethylbilane synthase [Bacteroidota bacterium]
MVPDPIVLGTRGSQLALWQAGRVKDQIERAGHPVTLQQITTRGDEVQDVPLSEVGDEALFTKELDRAMLRGEVDIAVHSLKDLPSRIPDGIELAAVSDRASPFDAFVAHPSFDGALEALPDGATIATSSLRRRAQLKAWRTDLRIVPVRGNVDSRLDKLAASDWHGMVLAVAGLTRMGRDDAIRTAFSPSIMIPAVGQGALGVTCRTEDTALQALLQDLIHDRATGRAAAAERGFMKRIGGGCHVPTGAWARETDDGRLLVDGCIAALDGSQLFRDRRVCAGGDEAATGAALATHLLDAGGAEIIAAVRATS